MVTGGLGPNVSHPQMLTTGSDSTPPSTVLILIRLSLSRCIRPTDKVGLLDILF